MIKLLMIADDFSGALDAGVQFAAAAGAAFFVVKYLQKFSQPLQLFYGKP